MNACVKVEASDAKRHGVKTFAELSDEQKQQSYRSMEKDYAHLASLSNMPRYQAGRERRRRRLKIRYMNERHRQRVFEKMKSLSTVPDPDNTQNDVSAYKSVEFMEETFSSVLSSETVIHISSPRITNTSKNRQNILSQRNEIVVIEAELLQHERFVPSYSQSQSTQMSQDQMTEKSDSMKSAIVRPEDINEIIESSDDDLRSATARNRFNLRALNSPARSSPRRSPRGSPAVSYSQFGRDGVITSTQQ